MVATLWHVDRCAVAAVLSSAALPAGPDTWGAEAPGCSRVACICGGKEQQGSRSAHMLPSCTMVQIMLALHILPCRQLAVMLTTWEL